MIEANKGVFIPKQFMPSFIKTKAIYERIAIEMITFSANNYVE